MVACAGTGQLDSRQAAVAPGTSVVAFSVDTRKLEKDDSWARPVEIHLRFGDGSASFSLSDRKGPQRILFEVPGDAITIDQFEMEAGAGIFWRRYGTLLDENLVLVPGKVNYLGRLTVEDVQFEPVDDSRVRPIGAKLVFADAMADDLAAWKGQYEIFRNMNPERQVIGYLAGEGYLAVWARDGSNNYAQDLAERAFDGSVYEPQRGPRADPSPR